MFTGGRTMDLDVIADFDRVTDDGIADERKTRISTALVAANAAWLAGHPWRDPGCSPRPSTPHQDDVACNCCQPRGNAP